MNKRTYDSINAWQEIEILKDVKENVYLVICERKDELWLPFEDIKVEVNVPFPENTIEKGANRNRGFLQSLLSETSFYGGYECWLDHKRAMRIMQREGETIYKGFIESGTRYIYGVGFFAAESVVITEKLK